MTSRSATTYVYRKWRHTCNGVLLTCSFQPNGYALAIESEFALSFYDSLAITIKELCVCAMRWERSTLELACISISHHPV